MTEQNGADTGKKQKLTPDQGAAAIKGLMTPPAAEKPPVKGAKPPVKAEKPKVAAGSTDAPAKKAPVKNKKDAQAEAAEGADDGQPEDDLEGAEDLDDSLEPTDDDQDQPDDGQDPEGDDDAGEDENTDEGSEDDLHAVILDGKEEKVTYEELVKGYQRQADYTKKTELLSKERKSVQALQEQIKDLPQVRQRFVEESDRFVKNAALTLTALDKRFMPQRPDESLLDTDPKAFYRAKEAHEGAVQFRQALVHEVNRIDQEQKIENERTKKQAIAASRQKLFEVIPEMKDGAFRAKLTEFIKGAGFTVEQIAEETNVPLFQWALDSMRYREIMAKKAKFATDNPRPKVAKQSKAPTSHAAIETRKRTGAIEHHKSKRSVDSAARALAGIMQNGKRS